jgi:enterochelin esterase-like enzyme
MTITKDDIAPKFVNGVAVEMTEEEKQARVDEWNAWNNESANRKLAQIKEIRLQKLMETDYYALQDVIMSNEMKAWRLNLRNIPQDYTTEEEYDLLLARDEETGELTHSIWTQPKE